METTVNTRKSTVIFCIFLSVAVLFTARRDICTAGAARGLSFCISTLIPAVFPFSVVCKVLARTVNVRYFGAVFTCLVCGAPSGAYMCADMYKNGCSDKRTSELLCAVTNGMTPTFVIGFVGVYCLQSASKGVFVYLVCSFSTLLYSFVVIKRISLSFYNIYDISFSSAFTEAVFQSTSSVISLCGLTVFFSVVCEFVSAFFSFLPPSFLSFFFLFGELITGILQSRALGAVITDRLFCSLMCAFTSFSGVCIHLQITSVMSRAGLSSRQFVKGKLIQSLASFIISYIFYGIIFG